MTERFILNENLIYLGNKCVHASFKGIAIGDILNEVVDSGLSISTLEAYTATSACEECL